MKILVKTTCSSDLSWCQYLLVTLTSETVKEILERRELFQMVNSKSDGLWSLSFWGVPGDFYDDLDFERLLNEKQCADFEDEDFMVLPDDFEIPDDIEPARTECDRLVITQDDFYWKAMPKHTDVYVETFNIPYNVLLEGEKR